MCIHDKNLSGTHVSSEIWSIYSSLSTLLIDSNRLLQLTSYFSPSPAVSSLTNLYNRLLRHAVNPFQTTLCTLFSMHFRASEVVVAPVVVYWFRVCSSEVSTLYFSGGDADRRRRGRETPHESTGWEDEKRRGRSPSLPGLMDILTLLSLDYSSVRVRFTRVLSRGTRVCPWAW